MPPPMYWELMSAARDGLVARAARPLSEIERLERTLSTRRAVERLWGEDTDRRLARISRAFGQSQEIFAFIQESGLGADPRWLARFDEFLEKAERHNAVVTLRRKHGRALAGDGEGA